MTIDEIVELVRAIGENLSPVQEGVLRQAWQGATYTRMETELGYDAHYLRNVASQLWRLLSDIFDGQITKANLRPTLELRELTSQERLLLSELSRPVAPAPQVEFPGTPLALDSPLYIERPPIEELTQAELHQPGCAIRIRGSRRMGKSSLLLRLLDCAKHSGYHTVTLDFQRAETSVLSDLNKLLRWFCANLALSVQLSPKLDEVWDEDIGGKISCTLYIQHYILETLSRPLVLALQEVNRLFEFPEVAQEFFPLLRSWHEEAKQIAAWQKLRLVVVHSTEVYIPLDINRSPFNVGLPVVLPDFSIEQICELARRYGLTWTDDSQAKRLVETIGGSPYLVSLALYHLSQSNDSGLSQPRNLDRILAEAPTLSSIYRDRLRELWDTLQSHPELLNSLDRVLSSPNGCFLEPILAYKLDSLGLVRIHGNTVTISCQLYRQYFQEQLAAWKSDPGALTGETDEAPDLSSTIDRLVTWERENQSLQQLCYIDELTQIPNRRYFDLRLQDAWQELSRTQQPLSVLSCDIDFFKSYNDRYGRTMGDACLQRIALGILSVVGDWTSENVVARSGGEEFAVLLPQTDAKMAMRVAREICRGVRMLRIKRDLQAELPATVVTVSIGVASEQPAEDTMANPLWQAADLALYDAKEQGRDRVALSQTYQFGWQTSQETDSISSEF
ncbi:MAG: AAA-like domain-containing protein [Cyanobacteria bacterium SID2]|nr:AAA-like domain-containing protein [Cyanobacteria bacterium SID2]MBP0003312.1 AAA-like domain-containing protein [Cyanobacteria bacterium SBC]